MSQRFTVSFAGLSLASLLVGGASVLTGCAVDTSDEARPEVAAAPMATQTAGIVIGSAPAEPIVIGSGQKGPAEPIVIGSIKRLDDPIVIGSIDAECYETCSKYYLPAYCESACSDH